jgi:hypothetical protein
MVKILIIGHLAVSKKWSKNISDSQAVLVLTLTRTKRNRLSKLHSIKMRVKMKRVKKKTLSIASLHLCRKNLYRLTAIQNLSQRTKKIIVLRQTWRKAIISRTFLLYLVEADRMWRCMWQTLAKEKERKNLKITLTRTKIKI